MASCSQPRLKSYKAGGAINPYCFVKFGADNQTVVACGANEKAIGIFMGNVAAASGDHIDVALPGGGAKLKVSEAVALGDNLTSIAAGQGEVADADGEWVGAIAYEVGATNDIIGVEVVAFPEFIAA